MYEYMIPDEDTECEPEIICSECRDPCRAVEETFNYVGTHCTHGKPGTHHTGIYVSDCCGAEIEYA